MCALVVKRDETTTTTKIQYTYHHNAIWIKEKYQNIQTINISSTILNPLMITFGTAFGTVNAVFQYVSMKERLLYEKTVPCYDVLYSHHGGINLQ